MRRFTTKAGFVLVAAVLAAPGTYATSAQAKGIEPVVDADFHRDAGFSREEVALGRALFFDKLLGGNRNVACATCHHPTFGSSDGVALSFGEGAVGLGPDRRTTAEQPVLARVPRNAQALWFVGAREFERLYHDGRVERDQNDNWPSGFWSPAREQLPAGLESVLAVQALFPLVSPIEMAGHKGENEVATAVALDRLEGSDGAWALLARRLAQVPEYVALFTAAFDDVEDASDITMVHAANAIAAFETTAFRADESPFDAFLRTRDSSHLSEPARSGMKLFYGRARCAACHGGKFLTDQSFHAVAMPQIGPGKNDGFDRSYWRETGFAGRLEDLGRYRVTFRAQDRFRFRTPTLRNVELTGPWGHAGAYARLEDVVRHHLDPVAALSRYETPADALAPLEHVVERTAVGSRLQFRPVNPRRLVDYQRRDGWVMRAPGLRDAIAVANELEPTELDDDEVADLVAFLHALTDPRSRDQQHLVPASVPSGLPVSD